MTCAQIAPADALAPAVAVDDREAVRIIVCPVCGQEIKAKGRNRNRRIYCGRRCLNRAWMAQHPRLKPRAPRPRRAPRLSRVDRLARLIEWLGRYPLTCVPAATVADLYRTELEIGPRAAAADLALLSGRGLIKLHPDGLVVRRFKLDEREEAA